MVEEYYLKNLVRDNLHFELTPEYKFHPIRKWRFDYAITHKKIAIEIEGGEYIQGRHMRPAGYAADCEKYNTATIMGWRVLRYTRGQLRKDPRQPFEDIQKLIIN